MRSLVSGPMQYGTRYSATRQFFSTTVLLLLRRGFSTLVLFIQCSNCFISIHDEAMDTNETITTLKMAYRTLLDVICFSDR